ncbi:unnamed protein product [Phytomonas sp. EM1]|nr:unnamed protein product [Phytomonas sp. EM1]|eukprot:CCW64644.1 unnamed protein product [Phytomonas sp. isolate EM1]
MATTACNSEVPLLDIDIIRHPFLGGIQDEGGAISGKPPIRDSIDTRATPKILEASKVPRGGNGSPCSNVPQRLFGTSNSSTPAPEKRSPVGKNTSANFPGDLSYAAGWIGQRPAAVATPCSSVSSLRIPSTARLGILPKALNTTVMRPPSTMPSNGFSQYAFDIAKTLKEIVHCRDEGVFLRVLPKAHLVNQHTFQEACAREQMVLQEANMRMLIVHKCAEDRAKKEEQQLIRRSKERQEDLKRRHAEELIEQKNTVMHYNTVLEQGLRERLKLLVQLQPRLNLINVVLATLKDESNNLSLIAELLEEAKKLQKALKTDLRFNKTATPELDGGALPYWLKHCLTTSFNVAAILKGSPYRAVVQDAPNIRSKLLSDRKIITIREVRGAEFSEGVLAWVHTRVALPDVTSAAEAFLEFAESDAGVPAGSCQGVVWTKEDHNSVVRAAKAAGNTIAALGAVSRSTLSYGNVASIELTAKDVKSIGEAAAV